MKGFLLTGSVNTSTNHCTRAACPVALKHVKEIINVKSKKQK